jgi:hypothetical protein
MKLLPVALLTAALGRAADPGAGGLAGVRLLLEAEVAPPQLSIELPGVKYKCYRMRLVSARGLAARRVLEDLKATLDRIREELAAFDGGHGSSDKVFSLAQTFEARAAEAAGKGLIVDEPPHDLFGVGLSPRRLRSSVVDGDYELQRDPALPDCALAQAPSAQ